MCPCHRRCGKRMKFRELSSSSAIASWAAPLQLLEKASPRQPQKHPMRHQSQWPMDGLWQHASVRRHQQQPLRLHTRRPVGKLHLLRCKTSRAFHRKVCPVAREGELAKQSDGRWRWYTTKTKVSPKSNSRGVFPSAAARSNRNRNHCQKTAVSGAFV